MMYNQVAFQHPGTLWPVQDQVQQLKMPKDLYSNPESRKGDIQSNKINCLSHECFL